MDLLKKGWFSEVGEMWPGQAFSLEVEEVLFEGRSDYQDVVVFQSKTYGTVLVLDGVIQVTERDEFSYQEMLAHLPMCSHPAPKKVLVIGGGDGGILREVGKHACVEEITICEIDKMVIEVSKKYLPFMACGYDDPRVNVVVGDGCKYLQDNANTYDVIIVDSSDPIGPAEVLFEKPFYLALHKALREGGIAATQAECLWLHLDLISNLMRQNRDIYTKAEYAYGTTPSYPSGQLGYCLCSKNERGCTKPVRELPEGTKLRYYSPRVHEAAFVLPVFAQKAVQGEVD